MALVTWVLSVHQRSFQPKVSWIYRKSSTPLKFIKNR